LASPWSTPLTSRFPGSVATRLHLPAKTEGPVPAVVRFQGYGGGRGLPLEVSAWTLAGYASLIMDTRGQGFAWIPGATADPVGAAPSHPGFTTRGILDPNEYYHRRAYADAVLALDAVRSHPMVQRDKVATSGASREGGISLAVAALAPDLWAALIDVPFLFRRYQRHRQAVATGARASLCTTGYVVMRTRAWEPQLVDDVLTSSP
jgi:cephalosporin-C deacetylase-like acetyl esterase